MAPHLSSPMIQADKSICIESRFVLRSPENRTRVILAEQVAIPQKNITVHYRC